MKPADHIVPPGKDDWIHRRLADLERQIRELRAERRLGQSTVEAGSLDIKGGRVAVYDDDGSLLAVLGDLGDLVPGMRGTAIYRAGQSLAFALYGSGPGAASGFVGIYDRSGNYIVTDDAASARGVARPYIPIPVNEITPPTATTASATFADVLVGPVVLQHPVLYAYLVVQASDGTTAGEVRVALDGVGIGPVATVAAGAFAYAPIGPFLVPSPGAYGLFRTLSIQARRTAGSGTIGARALAIFGLESAYAQ